jgi:hypothetical protein
VAEVMPIALLRELEERLLRQAVRLDESALTLLLADDFVEHGASGQVWTKADVIVGLLSEAFVTRRIYDFDVRWLSVDIALATYRCGTASVDGVEFFSLRSSIWRKRPDGWQMVFHQGTKIPA